MGPRAITRRGAVGLLTSLGLAASARAADDGHALFWRCQAPGQPAKIAFGYVRIAADLVPDIATEAAKYIAGSAKLLVDTRNFQLPAEKLPATAPLVARLQPKTVDALRAALMTINPSSAATLNRMSGIAAVILLSGEGTEVPDPSLGSVLADRAVKLGRPVEVLVRDAEVQGAVKHFDAVRAEASVGDAQVRYLLDLRARIGPLGRHFDDLYRLHDGAASMAYFDDLTAHGLITPGALLRTARLRALVTDRYEAILRNPAEPGSFALLHLPDLIGPSGLLADLRIRGIRVDALS